jgi:hypothetical protein
MFTAPHGSYFLILTLKNGLAILPHYPGYNFAHFFGTEFYLPPDTFSIYETVTFRHNITPTDSTG